MSQISPETLLGIGAFFSPPVLFFILHRIFSERVATLSLLFGLPLVLISSSILLSPSSLIIYAAVAAPVSGILGIVAVFYGEYKGTIRALMIIGIIFSIWPYVLLMTCPWILMLSSNIGD